ncbi:hypothetical protein M408DRAFT_328918 [Serendipita vermifera MAFF 305830]|uniref:Uncharacterized protein n=1 Tax=Serendipita vermifera MAFF 305830 TaxID=933852 RepID=A0A0C2XJM2_SERVB|nr:hypothetical protein M408DRAFT_328918 [Serendipita vermifera MAFF 305830]
MRPAHPSSKTDIPGCYTIREACSARSWALIASGDHRTVYTLDPGIAYDWLRPKLGHEIVEGLDVTRWDITGVFGNIASYQPFDVETQNIWWSNPN